MLFPYLDNVVRGTLFFRICSEHACGFSTASGAATVRMYNYNILEYKKRLYNLLITSVGGKRQILDNITGILK